MVTFYEYHDDDDDDDDDVVIVVVVNSSGGGGGGISSIYLFVFVLYIVRFLCFYNFMVNRIIIIIIIIMKYIPVSPCTCIVRYLKMR